MDGHDKLLLSILCGARLLRVALKCESHKLPPEPVDCGSQREYDRMRAERDAGIFGFLPEWMRGGKILEEFTLAEIINVPDEV